MEALKEKNRRNSNIKNRVSEEGEQVVVAFALSGTGVCSNVFESSTTWPDLDDLKCSRLCQAAYQLLFPLLGRTMCAGFGITGKM